MFQLKLDLLEFDLDVVLNRFQVFVLLFGFLVFTHLLLQVTHHCCQISVPLDEIVVSLLLDFKALVLFLVLAHWNSHS